MKLQTRVFELYKGKYKSLIELAEAMGISMSQVYRVRQGKHRINEKFLIGATRAFPEYKLDKLFYVQETAEAETPNRPANERIEQIMNMLVCHPEDMSYQKIADVVECSRQNVHKVAKSAGLTRDTKPPHYRSDITVERVLKLYHQDLLVKDIAQSLSCDVVTVRNRLRVAGISKSECYSRSKNLDQRGSSSKIGK